MFHILCQCFNHEYYNQIDSSLTKMSKGIILYRNLSFFNVIYFLFVTKSQNILLMLT